MRNEEEEEEWLYSAGWCYIFSHLLHRFEVVIQCCLHDEIVLTAYERAHILTGDLLFLGSLYSETISIILSSVLFLNSVSLR